jgi:hypothetical protein
MLLSPRVAALCAGTVLAAGAHGQTNPLQSRQVKWGTDSGFVTPAVKGSDYSVVYTTTVFVPQSPWVRLNFGPTALPGAIEEGRGSYLRITSLYDGAVQYLNSESLSQWANTSAYFNGNAVKVELFAKPGVGPSRVSISEVTAGLPDPGFPDTICGPTDDRVLSTDPRSSRHVPEGCSTWLFNDINRTFLTAGHCGVGSGDVQQFNVPLSNSNGSINAPPPEDQYPVDAASVSFNNGGIGLDACYFACFVNSNTGMTAFQKQGQHYTLRSSVPAAPASPPAAGQNIRITGYGTTSSALAPLTWNQVQKTHVGPYWSFSGTTVRYQTDTTGGNSGSAVVYESEGTVIGIHTHGGCTGSGGPGTSSNAGTAISYPTLQNFLANPKTLCLSGQGVVTPPLYAIGDGQNNFGTLNMNTGNFAKVDFGPVRMEGMAYNSNSGLFYAINYDTFPSAQRRLYTINPSTGAATLLGVVTGVPNPINGLGYDPATDTLYGVQQANGQLCTINVSTLIATAIGPTNPTRTIGALEFSPMDNALYGIDDAGGASKLVKWTSPTSAPVQVGGGLGAGFNDCNGLGVTDDGQLWTMHSGRLLRVSPTTGLATIVGFTNAVFGASYGISAILTPPAPACYANCDQSSGSPLLTANDFQCFLNKFAAGDTYANCDGSTGIPALTANDFQCYLNKFAAGCS